tara:strand:+ start:11250 stop:12518 length:1269 start_codon:yes stop_codon:yes gene_type:complete
MFKIIKDKNIFEKIINDRIKFSFSKSSIVDEILSKIKNGGDSELIKFTKKFDKVNIDKIRVSQKIIEESIDNVDSELIKSILEAKENIENFHKKQKPKNFELIQKDKTKIYFEHRPIKRVGVYIPGGRFPLFSTALMNIIPAKIAGVNEIILCSPPQSSGYPNDIILSIAKIMGISEVYNIGGAQAIAAMAYGTDSIKKVDKITGPGNIFVSKAKQFVSDIVGIDMIAGPTEQLVVADDSADPLIIASDLICQAEHDVNSWSVLITDSIKIVNQVNDIINENFKSNKISQVAKESIVNNGFIYLVNSRKEFIESINKISPEHLSLQIKNSRSIISKIIAGVIFLGNNTSPAWGDYWAGPNHTLPTSGQSRFKSALSVNDFMVSYSIIESTNKALKTKGKVVMSLAKAEGLLAHSESIKVRIK